MSRVLARLAHTLLDLALGSGRAGAPRERVVPRPSDAYFHAFTDRCMAFVYRSELARLSVGEDGDA